MACRATGNGDRHQRHLAGAGGRHRLAALLVRDAWSPAVVPLTHPLESWFFYPHSMGMGGSQLNAIQLAAAVRDLGHDVARDRRTGDAEPAGERPRARAKLFISARRRRPSPTVTMRLPPLARSASAISHHPRVRMAASARRGPGALLPIAARLAAALCTIMSMAVAPFLPASMSVVGTRALQQPPPHGHQATRPVLPHLIEPPVDVEENSPGHPTAAFRSEFGLGPGLLSSTSSS